MKNSRNGFWLRDQRGKEFVLVLVLVLVLESDSTRTRTRTRKQKRLQFRKTGMKAFEESWRKQIVRQAHSSSACSSNLIRRGRGRGRENKNAFNSAKRE